ncbi:MAG: hypothetical protein NUW37_09580 [Planctomycetes bacterium]|nr:hypothetical protein [Planctomycetota bacterium]
MNRFLAAFSMITIIALGVFFVWNLTQTDDDNAFPIVVSATDGNDKIAEKDFPDMYASSAIDARTCADEDCEPARTKRESSSEELLRRESELVWTDEDRWKEYVYYIGMDNITPSTLLYMPQRYDYYSEHLNGLAGSLVSMFASTHKISYETYLAMVPVGRDVLERKYLRDEDALRERLLSIVPPDTASAFMEYMDEYEVNETPDYWLDEYEAYLEEWDEIEKCDDTCNIFIIPCPDHPFPKGKSSGDIVKIIVELAPYFNRSEIDKTISLLDTEDYWSKYRVCEVLYALAEAGLDVSTAVSPLVRHLDLASREPSFFYEVRYPDPGPRPLFDTSSEIYSFMDKAFDTLARIGPESVRALPVAREFLRLLAEKVGYRSETEDIFNFIGSLGETASEMIPYLITVANESIENPSTTVFVTSDCKYAAIFNLGKIGIASPDVLHFIKELFNNYIGTNLNDRPTIVVRLNIGGVKFDVPVPLAYAGVLTCENLTPYLSNEIVEQLRIIVDSDEKIMSLAASKVLCKIEGFEGVALRKAVSYLGDEEIWVNLASLELIEIIARGGDLSSEEIDTAVSVIAELSRDDEIAIRDAATRTLSVFRRRTP